jgi:hypothetical protein
LKQQYTGTLGNERMPGIPQYVRDSIHRIVVAAVNLWMWAFVIETKACPKDAIHFWIRGRDLALEGPQNLKGKVVKVTFEIEDEAPRPW